MKTMQEGLDLLTAKYSSRGAVIDADGLGVSVGGRHYPLLPWESERRFFELRDIVAKQIGSLSVCRIMHIAKKDADMSELLLREAGVIEYVTSSCCREVFAVAADRVLNAVITTEAGCVCTVELAATLSDGEADIDKHEFIADNGIACDRAVDTQVPQESIYVLGKYEAVFRDTDAELYGLSDSETASVRNAFRVACDTNTGEKNAVKRAHLEKAVKAALDSAARLENVRIGE